MDFSHKPYCIEFWFLDWFDGAFVTVDGADFDLLSEWLANMDDCGVLTQKFKEATE